MSAYDHSGRVLPRMHRRSPAFHAEVDQPEADLGDGCRRAGCELDVVPGSVALVADCSPVAVRRGQRAGSGSAIVLDPVVDSVVDAVAVAPSRVSSS